jgi:hypothetical protein
MQTTFIGCHSASERRLLAQMASALDPLAAQYLGAEAATVRPALRLAWHTAFGTDIPEPTQSRCIAAITAGHPWQLALWSNG